MTTSAEPASGFAALGLTTALMDTLSALGYEEPTPIQREAIPPLLAGRDLVGHAGAGTRQRAAFALPVLQGLDRGGTWASGCCRCTAGSPSAGSCRRCDGAWTWWSGRRGGCWTPSAGRRCNWAGCVPWSW